MAKKTNVKGEKGKYPFQEKGGSHSKSRAPHHHAGPKDPRKGGAHNIQQPEEAQAGTVSPNDGSDGMGEMMNTTSPSNPMQPRESRPRGFGGLRQ